MSKPTPPPPERLSEEQISLAHQHIARLLVAGQREASSILADIVFAYERELEERDDHEAAMKTKDQHIAILEEELAELKRELGSQGAGA